ncbi:MAG: preprotein translocase subunit SecE [Calditrichaeota bacterium]|nr:preprotein translocase subunit SecE [Calditrichota bacterium]
MIGKAAKYIGDVRTEMAKVIWPTRQQLIESSVIVVVLSIILAIFTFGVDVILNRILKFIL